MKSKSLVSITDFTKEEYIKILDLAEEFEKNPNQKLLDGFVVATLFFEPSTRTRLSFESAVNRLGGRVIGFTEAATSSVSKGETLKDTIMSQNNSEIRYLTPPTVEIKKKKYCRFKKNKIKYVDYKDPEFLKKFLNEQGKILPRRLTGTSLKYQKKVAQAVKRARHLALLPFVTDLLK